MITNVVASYNTDISSEEIQPGMAGVSAQGHEAEIKVLAELRLWEEAASESTQVIGRTQFHMVVGQRALPTRGCPRGCPHSPPVWPPPPPRSAGGCQMPVCASNLYLSGEQLDKLFF